MSLFTVFVRDHVVVVHDLKNMVSFTVFGKDRAVLVHDLKTMVTRITRSLTNTVNETMFFRS
jgi:hypothetical protein